VKRNPYLGSSAICDCSVFTNFAHFSPFSRRVAAIRNALRIPELPHGPIDDKGNRKMQLKIAQTMAEGGLEWSHRGLRGPIREGDGDNEKCKLSNMQRN